MPKLMGKAIKRESNAVDKVPIIGIIAPKSLVVGFQLVEVKNPHPNAFMLVKLPMKRVPTIETTVRRKRTAKVQLRI